MYTIIYICISQYIIYIYIYIFIYMHTYIQTYPYKGKMHRPFAQLTKHQRKHDNLATGGGSIYIHTYIHTHMHTCIYLHRKGQVYAYIHKSMHVRTSNIQTYRQTDMHAYIPADRRRGRTDRQADRQRRTGKQAGRQAGRQTTRPHGGA